VVNKLFSALQSVAEQLSHRLNQLANQYNPITANAEQHAPVALVDVDVEAASNKHAVHEDEGIDTGGIGQPEIEKNSEYTVGVRELALAEHERREAQREQHAAASIQRVYRGFRVRKAILPLLSKHKTTLSTPSRSPPTTTAIESPLYNDSPTNQPSPPTSPLYYTKYATPTITPPQEPLPRPSYSPIASPPLQPDSMSVINIFTRGVLGGKYRISMEENGLLTLSLNKRDESADVNQVRGIIQNINQSICDHTTSTADRVNPSSSPVSSHRSALLPEVVPYDNVAISNGSEGLELVPEPDLDEDLLVSPRHSVSSPPRYVTDNKYIPTTPSVATGKQASSPNSLYLQYVPFPISSPSSFSLSF
jgi:hypothetical protein